MRKPPSSSFDATSWGNQVAQTKFVPEISNLEEKKRQFGLELARLNANDHDARLDAALAVFPETSIALWASQHLWADPAVLEARQSYTPPPKPLLDKEGLAAKLLECAEEKIERNGQKHYVNEAKERLGFYNLYSKIMGFIDKPAESNTNNFVSNEMKIVLVKPPEAETKAIESVKQVKDEPVNITPLRIKAI